MHLSGEVRSIAELDAHPAHLVVGRETAAGAFPNPGGRSLLTPDGVEA